MIRHCVIIYKIQCVVNRRDFNIATAKGHLLLFNLIFLIKSILAFRRHMFCVIYVPFDGRESGVPYIAGDRKRL